MRKLGVAVLGLFIGLVTGLLLTDVIARLALAAGVHLPDALPLAILLGFLSPILAVAGVVVALGIDGRARRRDELR